MGFCISKICVEDINYIEMNEINCFDKYLINRIKLPKEDIHIFKECNKINLKYSTAKKIVNTINNSSLDNCKDNDYLTITIYSSFIYVSIKNYTTGEEKYSIAFNLCNL